MSFGGRRGFDAAYTLAAIWNFPTDVLLLVEWTSTSNHPPRHPRQNLTFFVRIGLAFPVDF